MELSKVECDKCGKNILIKGFQITFEHFKSHENKKFKCKICVNKFFSKKSNLKSHYLNSHQEISRKHLNELLSDLKPQKVDPKETKHKCKICEKYFTRGQNLRNHLKTHDAQVKIQCKYCSKSLDQKNMKRHFQRCLKIPTHLQKRAKLAKIPSANEKTKSKQSQHFRKIQTNVFSNSAKAARLSNSPQCSCKPEYECGENCLNRLDYTECNPKTCPSGIRCSNTKIQKKIYASVEQFSTKNKGVGVKTNKIIKKGSFIIEYVGEIVSMNIKNESTHATKITVIITVCS